MWQISLQRKNQMGKLVTLTTSKYPNKAAAHSAATQLRLLSRGWNEAIRSIECERPNAKKPTWRFHNYTVSSPVEVKS